ncbi:MAG: hypothetical protein ACOY9J_07025 [Pseudomonadota bacterium]
MGSKWEVLSYVPDETIPHKYYWLDVYRGQSFWQAMLAAYKEKRRYSLGCIQVNWR